jgi:hypothetical protein
MKEQNNKKREPDFEDLSMMVARLDEIIRKEGKTSESYKSQHTNVVKLVNKLNQNNKGYTSISDARAANTSFNKMKGIKI